MFTRDQQINRLNNPDKIWDILVIGGGATGLGIALDAATRGYKVLLAEQCDFAKGTSSRSTKLVHGGVRYLAQGDLRLVREASVERGLLLKNAPHLVKDQIFIVPVYNYWESIKYTIGLKLYDRIAGKLRLGSSVFISKNETIKKLPGIVPKGLKGAVLYHDGQFDDSRLAVNLAQSIWENGGVALNYLKVTGFTKSIQGIITGATVTDTETKKNYGVKAKAVVNATGVFVDDILQMDKPGSAKSISVSQGVHIVLDKKFNPSADALMIPQTSDGRILFAVPWHNKIVVGTTDTPVNETLLEPEALEKEINFILQTSAAYFIKKPQRCDVLSVFAGLRPLAAPKHGHQKTKEISRSHKIIMSSSQLFTILGGKWTTYRKMGEDMINRVEKELKWDHQIPVTVSLHIHGYKENTDWQHPFYFYGSDAELLLMQMDVDADPCLSEELSIYPCQVKWAVQNEMARTVEDVLARRTRALFLNARESLRIAPKVAAIMAVTLGEDEKWQQDQLAEFSLLAEKYILA